MIPLLCSTLMLAVLAGCGTTFNPGATRKPTGATAAKADATWLALPYACVLTAGGFAGSQAVSTAELFGTEQDAWEKLPAMPTARGNAAAA